MGASSRTNGTRARRARRSEDRRMKSIVRSVVLVLACATIASAQGNPDWHAQFPPFKIAGNLYYVGTADLAVYLIRTPQGNILINPTSLQTCRRCERASNSSGSSTAT